MKPSMLALFAVVVASQLSACATEEEVSGWAAVESEDTAHTEDLEQGLISGGGGGGLGFSCTSTRCECTPGGDGTDRETCVGMDAVCHGHGATVKCTYPPGGPDLCSCDFSAAVVRPRLRAGALPGGAALAR